MKSSPGLAGDVVVHREKVQFRSSQASVTAISSEAGSAAGSDAAIAHGDEIWAYTTEADRRLWDELTPPPTRKFAVRLVTTYAGYTAESGLLEEIYKRGTAGRLIGDELYATDDGLLLAWHTKPIAPWQTPRWLAQMEANTRRNAFLRLFQNQWVTSEGEFVPMEWVEACTDSAWGPLRTRRSTPIWAALEIGLKHDQTALTACTFDHDDGQAKLVHHQTWQGSKDRPVDFRLQIEPAVLDLRRRFTLISLWCDPHQAEQLMQRLRGFDVPVVSFAQTPDNLTAMGSNLYTLLQTRSLVLYPDDAIRKAFAAATAVEIAGRAFKITKAHRADKVDLIVALAMAALAASRAGAAETPPLVIPDLGLAVGDQLVGDSFKNHDQFGNRLDGSTRFERPMLGSDWSCRH